MKVALPSGEQVDIPANVDPAIIQKILELGAIPAESEKFNRQMGMADALRGAQPAQGQIVRGTLGNRFVGGGSPWAAFAQNIAGAFLGRNAQSGLDSLNKQRADVLRGIGNHLTGGAKPSGQTPVATASVPGASTAELDALLRRIGVQDYRSY